MCCYGYFSNLVLLSTCGCAVDILCHHQDDVCKYLQTCQSLFVGQSDDHLLCLPPSTGVMCAVSTSTKARSLTLAKKTSTMKTSSV